MKPMEKMKGSRARNVGDFGNLHVSAVHWYDEAFVCATLGLSRSGADEAQSIGFVSR
jgi:hypothetical protein